MASASRSAIMAGVRSFTARSNNAAVSRILTPKSIPAAAARLGPRAASRPKPASIHLSYCRMVSALGAAESMLPLHSAIASARLKSSIAVDSSCWSWLSQGFATPL